MLPSSCTLVSEWAEFLPGTALQATYDRIFVLTDTRTRRHCLPLLKAFLPKETRFFSIPSGESHKTLESAGLVWDFLTRNAATRHSVLLNLGGGVVGDLGGFAASVYKRGMAFIQIPTTLLSMVDAALGGKTGVDFQQNKNHIGSFAQPAAVWIYPDFLKTLPGEEYRSGLAEVIKHALIADAAAFDRLRKLEPEYIDWRQSIPENLAIKAAITEADPVEKGERKKLNAGHTLGHALESYFLETGNPQTHGACVAAGLVMESRIAVEQGRLSEPELIRIEEWVFSVFGKLDFPPAAVPALIRRCRQDKKNTATHIRLSLIGPIGNCTVDVAVSEAEIRKALHYYRKGY